MIETILYLQLLFYAVIILMAIIFRSPAFFLLAFAFGAITAVGIASEGISLYNGWDGSVNKAAQTFDISPKYETLTVDTSDYVQAWYYAFFATAFIWLISAIVIIAIIIKTGRTGDNYARR